MSPISISVANVAFLRATLRDLTWRTGVFGVKTEFLTKKRVATVFKNGVFGVFFGKNGLKQGENAKTADFRSELKKIPSFTLTHPRQSHLSTVGALTD